MNEQLAGLLWLFGMLGVIVLGYRGAALLVYAEERTQEAGSPRDCDACGNTGLRAHERASGPPVTVTCSCEWGRHLD